MWLGGFNDGNTAPQFPCEKVDCPKSYLPEEYAVDFDRTAAVLGPFGTQNQELVCIMEGKCNSDSLHFNSTQVETIARCALKSFDDHLDATFMWTAHNEIEARWDYVKSWDNMWINKTPLAANTTAYHDLDFI